MALMPRVRGADACLGRMLRPAENGRVALQYWVRCLPVFATERAEPDSPPMLGPSRTGRADPQPDDAADRSTRRRSGARHRQGAARSGSCHWVGVPQPEGSRLGDDRSVACVACASVPSRNEPPCPTHPGPSWSARRSSREPVSTGEPGMAGPHQHRPMAVLHVQHVRLSQARSGNADAHPAVHR